MKNLIFAALVAVLFSGCSMSPEEIQLENQKLAIMKAVAEKPTLRCEQGCEYTDPKRNLAALFPTATNGWDFANKVLDTGIAVAPWLAVTKIAVDGLAASGNNTTNNDSYNSHSEANQANQSSVETVSGIKAGGNVDQSQQNQNNPTTTNTETNTTTNTDDNSSVVNTDDNSTVTTTTAPEVTPVVEP